MGAPRRGGLCHGAGRPLTAPGAFTPESNWPCETSCRHAVFPQWVFALIALVLVGSMNMIAVAWFGEMEVLFSLVKVGALVLFLIIGVIFLISGHQVAGVDTGFHLISQNGGVFPHGVLPAVIIVQGVVFCLCRHRVDWHGGGRGAGCQENPAARHQ